MHYGARVLADDMIEEFFESLPDRSGTLLLDELFA